MHLKQFGITLTWLQITILATHIDFIVYIVIRANICWFLWYVYFWVDKCVWGVICRSIGVCYCNIWACPKLFLWSTTNSARSVFTLSYVYYEYRGLRYGMYFFTLSILRILRYTCFNVTTNLIFTPIISSDVSPLHNTLLTS